MGKGEFGIWRGHVGIQQQKQGKYVTKEHQDFMLNNHAKKL
jgi:hypothetical protein